VAVALGGGGVQEQAGEEPDRLGLLLAGEASKPRAAETTIVVVQNNLPLLRTNPAEHAQANAGRRNRQRGPSAERTSL